MGIFPLLAYSKFHLILTTQLSAYGSISRQVNLPSFMLLDISTNGIHETDTNLHLGVVSPPRYVIEQVGVYISDGGTGVVNLDIGSAAYGRQSSAGRELVLFSVESQGKGSFESVETVVESVVAFSY